MPQNILSHQDLRELVKNKLTQVNVPSDHAQIVADVLVHANLRGVDSHGVLRTEHYVKRVKEGGLNVSPNIQVKKTGAVSAVLDGHDGFGHVVAQKAMETAIQLAKTNKVGIVGVVNSSHCGALSYFVNQAAEENLIGIAMTHTDKSVVPFGGAAPFFGTNPIAFGFPAKRHKPIILDMATSEVALGKILNAREKNSKIPENWGVDEKGNPTTDPFKVLSLLPFGGAKGYGLALAVDVLSGILTGSAFGPHIQPMYDKYNQMRKLGHFVCAIDPSIFNSGGSFLEDVDRLIDELHEVPAANHFDKVMVPGEPEQINETNNLAKGIQLPDSVYQYLTNS
ncbi:ureidoglycolate dehydrogenase [Metabacillus sp. RGM 3146]|uniref:ureidoglycolate dehydrogenase n=1 Tax=Metabacillus sp. RGM 3146 TaxID=3401092 RepID=UPI003B9BB7B8